MRQGKNLVGVDIGTTSIKVCQLKESRRGLSLVRFGYAPLQPQVIVDGQVMDTGAVVETLQRLFRDNKIRQRDENTVVLHNTRSSAEIEEDDPYAEFQIPDDLMW